MKFTGIVLEVKDKTAFIYTNNGEFRKVKIHSETPSIGQEYTGKSQGIHPIKGQIHPLRNFFFMLILIFSISSLCFTYLYFSSASTIIIDAGLSFQLNCNRWNTVVGSSSVDFKGNVILKKINLKKSGADEALIKIIKQCKTNHYIKEDTSILIYIHGNDINLSKLKKFASNNSIKLTINSNGEE
ncbi:anti-sigma factor domain-containing protein [Clostridium guangxiense]|uniref:anti-sigma factor domain-containing protein n=1 Tax=Clostridium guangxiense TaxID=1662055 RepID=UPI001E55C81A|nr:anti-sigma factor domain-containing protein [Clostridium guangxiense]MCD2348558.1 anti-sigma factor domain-containing protein [Clostridium guangxiense]